jgi:hypothetical protein
VQLFRFFYCDIKKSIAVKNKIYREEVLEIPLKWAYSCLIRTKNHLKNEVFEVKKNTFLRKAKITSLININNLY